MVNVSKKRHEQKIDLVAALIDAWVAYKNNRDSFEQGRSVVE